MSARSPAERRARIELHCSRDVRVVLMVGLGETLSRRSRLRIV
ncbi:hypothetical protein AKJ09_10434 [Labilithrix luteola]|uniref:Uncharacterized protein n=1 Tax=Labilithrix luteola TaxID=1391654 RepID=A0A0K1QDC7_9BACT|nr:hypothetical protein AKJ09_10434 [Labilithrix luteola]